MQCGAQLLAGDINGAEATFKEAEARDANNAEAKNFLRRIAEMRRGDGWLDREKTREQMLEEASRAWQRPQVFQERVVTTDTGPRVTPLMDKLNRITIANVNFSQQPLSTVVSTLSAVSEEYDTSGDDPKGVNIVLIDPKQENLWLQLHRVSRRPTLVAWKFLPTDPDEILRWNELLELRKRIFETGCATPIPDSLPIRWLVSTHLDTDSKVRECGPVIWSERRVGLIEVARSGR